MSCERYLAQLQTYCSGCDPRMHIFRTLRAAQRLTRLGKSRRLLFRPDQIPLIEHCPISALKQRDPSASRKSTDPGPPQFQQQIISSALA